MGQQFTIEVPGLLSSAIANRAPIQVTSVLRDRTPAPPERALQSNEVVWGGPSNFDYGNAEDLVSGPNVIVNYENKSDTVDPNTSPVDETWQEVSRVERDVTITGTKGASVTFKRIDEIKWRLPDVQGRAHYVTQLLHKFGDE